MDTLLTGIKGCGGLKYTDEWVKAMIVKNDAAAKNGAFLEGAKPWVESMVYLPFTAAKEGATAKEILESSVVEDVLFLRNHPLVKPSIPITGWIFSQETGLVEEVNCGLQDGCDPAQLELLKQQLAKRDQ
ncbi:carbonic anhydrase [Cladophialophora carrionii]|uniref:Carbonic anhydrase n=1 Tax=Cladophialophora carrionii TaxID=86049 RepID=A0A1C1CFV0_9EURO|nr:carbonic anhydrase [Cladophialophora carrionii]